MENSNTELKVQLPTHLYMRPQTIVPKLKRLNITWSTLAHRQVDPSMHVSAAKEEIISAFCMISTTDKHWREEVIKSVFDADEGCSVWIETETSCSHQYLLRANQSPSEPHETFDTHQQLVHPFLALTRPPLRATPQLHWSLNSGNMVLMT